MSDYLDEVGAQLADLAARRVHQRRRLRLADAIEARFAGPTRLVAQAVLVGLPLAVGVIVAAAVLSTRPARQPSTGGQNAGEAQIAPVLVRNFRILRRPVVAGDQLPSAYVNAPRGNDPRSPIRRYELVPALARGALIPSTNIEEWIEPGLRGYCLWVAERGPSGAPIGGSVQVGCAPISAVAHALAISGRAALAGGPPLRPLSTGEPVIVTGLVPDRAEAVELVTRSGATTRLQLAAGFFATRFARTDRLYEIVNHRRQLIAGAPQQISPSVSGTVAAQINLAPPSGAAAGRATGTAKVLKQGFLLTGIAIMAQNVPPAPKHGAYAVWLYAGPGHARLLGFVNPGPSPNGRLHTAGSLPQDAATFSMILLTIETKAAPRQPGKTILQGRFATG